MNRRPWLILVLLGLASAAIYTYFFADSYPLVELLRRRMPADIATMTGVSPRAALMYASAILALFVFYLLAMRAAVRWDCASAWPLVLGMGLLMAGLLIATYPFAASDLFLYAVRGRVLGVYGRSSMALAPDHFATGAYVPFDSEWISVASPYGPLWEWVAGLLAALGDSSPLRSLLVFKSFNLMCYAVCVWLIVCTLRARGSERILARTLAFAWNPLVLIETFANGHNDIFMLVFVLWALWAWATRRHTETLVALALGGLVKFMPWLLIPVTLARLWRRVPPRRWWAVTWRAGAVSLIVTLVLGWPLWPGLQQWGLLQQMGRGHYSIFAWLVITLRYAMSNAAAYVLAQDLLRLALAAAYGVILVRAFLHQDTLAQSFHLVLCAWLYVGAAAFGYWYITWLCVLIPFLDRPGRRYWTYALAWCGLMSVVLYAFVGRWVSGVLNNAGMHLWVVPFVFGLPWGLSGVIQRWFPPVLIPERQGRRLTLAPRAQRKGLWLARRP